MDNTQVTPSPQQISTAAKKRIRNILFLDDDSKRTEVAIKRYSQDNLYETSTAEQTIDLFKAEDFWDIISLDHDLGGEVYVNSVRKDCGMEVVRYMCTFVIPVRVVIIHTWNEQAAEVMSQKLRYVGYYVLQIPFHS